MRRFCGIGSVIIIGAAGVSVNELALMFAGLSGAFDVKMTGAECDTSVCASPKLWFCRASACTLNVNEVRSPGVQAPVRKSPLVGEHTPLPDLSTTSGENVRLQSRPVGYAPAGTSTTAGPSASKPPI